MTQASYNCIVCANEYVEEEFQSEASSKINSTRFKVCQACIEQCDPAEDYRQVRQIVDSYLKFAEARQFFEEAQDILDSRKK